VISDSKPRWQQVTALVSLGASGTITGFSFVPSAHADLTSPTSMPIRLMALERSAAAAPADDATLRSAIVNVANYYLRMAQGKTPAEMEAIIWQHDSIDGVDHGESCAAFASLTLELAAQVVGQRSWVTGGTTYPWPLHKWADVRVDPNPDSPGITSVLQDAQAHGRWHPLGDGYTPQPGDWVLFDGHVEVVTRYSGGVLSTIGGDSLPNFSVNAHEYGAPLAAQGVAGFVNNGDLAPAAKASPGGTQPATAASPQPSVPPATAQPSQGSSAIPGAPATGSAGPAAAQQASDAAIPGMPAPATSSGHARQPGRPRGRGHWHASHGAKPARATSPTPAVAADVPGASVYGPPMSPRPATAGGTAIPGLADPAKQGGSPAAPYRRHRPAPSTTPVSATSAHQAFINAVAPGAMATQRRYGVPAAVTIAQAIDESGWGQSMLAINDYNLFGIKGAGPAGSDVQPTEEYENGQWVTTNAPFRMYHNFAESIEDHGELLATSGYYTQAMADRNSPDAFANALTGVYATNPEYGADLVNIMQQYNLYRYDAAAPSTTPPPTRPTPAKTATPRPRRTSPTTAPSTAPPASSPSAPQPSAPAPSPSPSLATPGSPQPSPSSSWPTPAPTATAPSPASSGPSPAAADPSPTAAQPWPVIPGVTATAPGPLPTKAAPAPTGRRAPAAARRVPAGARRGSPAARRTSPPPAEPTPGATPDPTTQSFSYQHLSAAMSPIETTSAWRPTAPQSPIKTTSAWRPTTPQSPVETTSAWRPTTPGVRTPRTTTRKSKPAPVAYQLHMPPSVKNAFAATAKVPLTRSELLYRDVAGQTGIPWHLLAACDWMQCEARPRYSPVHGEKLGTVNADRTAYRTKSAALEQCAYDLIDLACSVYGIDLTARRPLTVGDLAGVFAAFRWGGLLRQHHTSPMEFPYSVAGLTVQHLNMRWPNIDEPHTPDKPGARFRMPFGAVPVVLSLHYPATA
jgi:Mannosyl-glycoprotein endo-beta-N-acetylglucosaminidase